MHMTTKQHYRRMVEDIFAEAGITINGPQPYDIQIKNEGFYGRFLNQGTLALGESYMEGWWDCRAINQMMARFAGAGLSRKFGGNARFLYTKMRAKLANEGSRQNAEHGVREHYDIGHDLYEAMLDPRLVYTCAYWNGATTLAQAQEQKLELVCQKLDLKPGQKVLDIGCGWGSFAKYAVEKYGVSVVGVTNSAAQAEKARELCAGLDIEIQLKDYREITGQYDRILSIGMFEHVCYKNHRTYMELVHRCLKDDGLSLLHTMGRKKSQVRGNDQWITKYIFPNTQVPSVQQIGEAIDDLFVMEDWENLSTDYATTLLAWQKNFEANWGQISGKYDERFFRMWNYYLFIFAGWYEARVLQLWQIVLSKNGVPGGYPFQKRRQPLLKGEVGRA